MFRHVSNIPSDASDGYLSDVPTYHSNGTSEVSHDLVVSTKVLEKNFRDKYEILRSAYEQRIKQISGVIQEMYSNICSDEVVKELKNDPSCSIYIPAHVTGLIEQFLTNDRENYIHQLIQRVSSTEVELSSYKKLNSSLREDYDKTLAQLKSSEKYFQRECQELQHKLSSVSNENEQLKSLLSKKEQEFNILEKSANNSSRELAYIESSDKREKQLKKELKITIQQLTSANTLLSQQNNEIKLMLSRKEQELHQANTKLGDMTQQDTQKNQHLEQLIQKFEVVLEQETKDNELSLVSIQEKMKSFRNKLIKELKHEKAISKELMQELQVAQYGNKEKQVQIDIQLEQLEKIQVQNQQLESERKILSQKIEDAKRDSHDAQLRQKELQTLVKEVEDKMLMQEKIFFQEKESLKDKITYDLQTKNKSDQEELEKKTLIHRLSQENQLHRISNDLKHAYSSFNTPIHSGMMENGPVDIIPLKDQISDEITLYQIIQRLTTEKQQILDNHRSELNQLRSEMIKHHKEEKQQLNRQNEQTHEELKRLLKNAATNIEKLKSIIQDHKSTIKLLHERIKNLDETVMQLNYQKLMQANVSNWKTLESSHNNRIVLTHQEETADKNGKELKSNSTRSPFFNKVDDSHRANTSRKPESFENVDHRIQTSVESAETFMQKNSKPLVSSDTTTEIKYSDVSVCSRNTTDESEKSALLKEETYRSQIVQYQADISNLRHEITNLAQKNLELQHSLENEKHQSNSTHSVPFSYASKGIQATITSERFDHEENSTIFTIDKYAAETTAPNNSGELGTPSFNILDSQLNVSEFQSHLKEKELLLSQLHQVTVDKEYFQEKYDSQLNVSEFQNHLKEKEQLLSQLHQVTVDKEYFQEKYEHQIILYNEVKNKLQGEKNAVTALNQRNVELQRITQQMHKSVLLAISSIRKEQFEIKLSFEQWQYLFEHEKQKTLSNLQLQFSIIFKHYHDRNERKLKDVRQKLSSKYHAEYKLLEEKYIEQVSKLNKLHTTELEKFNDQFLHHSSIVDENLPSNHGFHQKLDESDNHLKGRGILAFESTLAGILQGLQDHDIIHSDIVNKLLSLAKAHSEPSYAANAASRALICDELEKYFLNYLTVIDK